MRYPASEKAEIIQLVEQSHLPAKRTLDKLGIPRATFYRWYDRYRGSGPEALADHRSRPDRVWNRIPDDVRRQIIDLALELPELSPRELAVRFTDKKKYFVSEASVYRLLKAHDLITSPAYVVIKAANEFKDKTTAINQLWQTDFTYLKITGWGWYYLSTVLDDFSRFIVAWRLGPTMCASDVTATLDQALAASGLDRINVAHRPRLLSDNGASYVAGDLANWLEEKGMQHVRGAPSSRSRDRHAVVQSRVGQGLPASQGDTSDRANSAKSSVGGITKMPRRRKRSAPTCSPSRRSAISQRIVASEPVTERFGPRSTPIRTAPVICCDACAACVVVAAINPVGRLLIRFETRAATMPPPQDVACGETSAARLSRSASAGSTPVWFSPSTRMNSPATSGSTDHETSLSTGIGDFRPSNSTIAVTIAPQTKVGRPRSRPTAEAARRTTAVAAIPKATIAAPRFNATGLSSPSTRPPRLLRWLKRSKAKVARIATREGSEK